MTMTIYIERYEWFLLHMIVNKFASFLDVWKACMYLIEFGSYDV